MTRLSRLLFLARPGLLTLSLMAAALPPVARADIKGLPGTKSKEKDKEREKDREKLQGFNPEARPTNVSFIAGQTVEVELEAATAQLGGVKFIIREGPRFGTLSAVRPHPKDSHKALVSYVHNGSVTDLNDQFTYACRVDDGPISAPAVVTLSGKRAEPRIEVVTQAFFKPVLPGETASAKITLTNSGIGPFSADMNWQVPWQGPPRVELAVGETKEYLLTVKPTAPGVLTWETYLQPGVASSRLKLWIECSQPFVVSPGRIKLAFDESKGDRRGKVLISNATPEPMKLQLEATERLIAPQEFEVAAMSAKELELALPGNDVAEFKGQLWVINEPFRERVVVEADPEPAQVVLLAPREGKIDFGPQEKSKAGRATVVLRNNGGEPAVLAAQATPPFRIVDNVESLSLAPGAAREIGIEVLSDLPGRFANSVVFSGTGGKVVVLVNAVVKDPGIAEPGKPTVVTSGATKTQRARVAAGPGAAPSAPKPLAKTAPPPVPSAAAAGAGKVVASMPPAGGADAPAGGSANPGEAMRGMSDTTAGLFSYLAVFGMPIPPELRSPTLAKVGPIDVVERGRDHLVLSWQEQAGNEPKSYVVEQGYRVHNKATGMWLKAWRPLPAVENEKGSGGTHIVRLPGLIPSSQYELRVLGMDDQGKVSEPSDIHIIDTMAPARIPDWLWQVLAIVALSGIGFAGWRLKTGRWEV